MLEVKNLVKRYSTKGGVTVKALDDVSVKFPETGMVFLLGRSGSGKSTLLNVSGGLDKPDSGEIIVKGRSSSEFSTADFDSYRNTFIGFIFQEYNILNEFTVEQNIALALQLQSKPNDKAAVNALLEQVDLKGLGKRKPNTLSGGQKQRVAIARALIKEPEIIMADEPTGALDSNTGKQVFDTLKKLAETKLVIVVSHDRDFAEQYGDRIIELKDGKIISDVSKALSEVKQISDNVEVVSADTISIKNTEEITDADVKNIVKILKQNGGEAIITANKRELPNVKRACRINDKGSKEYFAETTDVKVKEYNGKETKFIKSKLPASHALKMGTSGLKTKPIRLIFAILLSVVAFVMFGVVSTFMLYDSNYSIALALQDANYPSITLSKSYDYISQGYEVDNETGEQTLEYENENTAFTRFGVKELADKNASGQGKFAGIFNFSNERYSGMEKTFSLMLGNTPISVNSDVANYYPVTSVYGFTDCGEAYMSSNGFNAMHGRYPATATEIAIPEYVANLFKNTEACKIDDISDLIGKKIKINSFNPSNVEFEIVGIYNVGAIPFKYDVLKTNNNSMSEKEKEKLIESLQDCLKLSFNTILYVSDTFYDEYKGNITDNGGIYINFDQAWGFRLSNNTITEEVQDTFESFYTEKTYADYQQYFKFYDFEGNEKTFSVDQNQVWVSKSMLEDEMKSKIENCFRQMTDNSNKIFFASLLGLDVKEGSAFSEIRNNLHMEGDIESALNYVEGYYTDIMYMDYIFNTAESMRNIANDDGLYASYNYSSEFGQKIDKISQYVSWLNMSNSEQPEPTKPTLADFEYLEEKVLLEVKANNTEKPKFEQLYYYRLAKDINQAIENSKDFNAVKETLNAGLGETKFESYGLLSNGGLSDTDFEKFKDVINTNYASIVGYAIKEPSQAFVPSLNVTIDKIYYKDFMGQSGELIVCGFFESQSNDNVQYLIHSDFAKAHAMQRDDYHGTTWINKEVTSYVEPEDARYNNIITLTDNSQEQIQNALLSAEGITYKITNNVYQQLDFFLEMITDMQQIFLIMGIVFGVFSALMLLNFISVSISAKKKDIGILRAVGARGADVFKIFFSEAFIITFICVIISVIGAFFTCNILNSTLVEIVSIQLLDFGIINVALIIAVALVISVVSTFFPVYFAAKKPPVESIRAL